MSDYITNRLEEGQEMKKNKKELGWLDQKMTNPKFRKAYREEYEKLAIGEQLLRLRLEAGMTQAEVAKEVGTTASAISRYENAECRSRSRTKTDKAETCGTWIRLTGPGSWPCSRSALG